MRACTHYVRLQPVVRGQLEMGLAETLKKVACALPSMSACIVHGSRLGHSP